MRVLEEIVKHAAIVGIYQLKPGEKNVFNRRNTVVLLVFGLILSLTLTYFFYVANSIQQYALSFFACMTMSLVFIEFSYAMLKTVEIFQFRDRVEKIILNRK